MVWSINFLSVGLSPSIRSLNVRPIKQRSNRPTDRPTDRLVSVPERSAPELQKENALSLDPTIPIALFVCHIDSSKMLSLALS